MSDRTIRESEATMKRRILVTLTGIAMSAVLITTGCAGLSGAATASPATSQTESSASSGQADSSAQTDDAGLSDQAASADNKDASGNPEGRSSSGKKSKDSASAETPAELRTVDPSAYAGQTVNGKVTAINGSQVTVTLGTFKLSLFLPKEEQVSHRINKGHIYSSRLIFEISCCICALVLLIYLSFWFRFAAVFLRNFPLTREVPLVFCVRLAANAFILHGLPSTK